jgi:hypothetical protein
MAVAMHASFSQKSPMWNIKIENSIKCFYILFRISGLLKEYVV